MGEFTKYPHALAWCDFETTSLPDGNDFSNVHVLEVAFIITDFDLNPQVGYEEVIKLTSAAADVLRANDVVKEMHRANGLIKESAAATKTLAEVEDEIVEMFSNDSTFDPGEFYIAGSGVARFDQPLIEEKMPKLAKWFHYAPFDIGVDRRVSMVLAGKEVVPPVRESFQEGFKKHRAMADAKAHLAEAARKREWYRSVT